MLIKEYNKENSQVATFFRVFVMVKFYAQLFSVPYKYFCTSGCNHGTFDTGQIRLPAHLRLAKHNTPHS